MISELSGENFRNLDRFSWHPVPGVQILTGANGAGKTSMLEAIYLLATTKSFRTGKVAECLQRGERRFSLSGEVSDEGRTRLSVEFENGIRRRSLNGSASSLAEHLQVLSVVLWDTSVGSLIQGAPRERRRFMDQGVVTLRPMGIDAITRYRRALEQKRRLLEDGRGHIAAWNEILATEAVKLIELRQIFVAELERELEGVLQESDLLPFSVRLRYRHSPAQGIESRESLLRELESVTDRERERRTPVIGPHRDDLEIFFERNVPARTGSTGERKSLGLALTAARGRVLRKLGKSPIYLLDDVDSELDGKRQKAVWDLFADAGQLIATTTDGEGVRGSEGVHIWHLGEGRIGQR